MNYDIFESKKSKMTIHHYISMILNIVFVSILSFISIFIFESFFCIYLKLFYLTDFIPSILTGCVVSYFLHLQVNRWIKEGLSTKEEAILYNKKTFKNSFLVILFFLFVIPKIFDFLGADIIEYLELVREVSDAEKNMILRK